MGGTPADDSNRPVAPPAPARARSSAAQKTQEHRRVLMIGCGMLSVAVLTVAAVFALQSSISTYLPNSPPTGSTTQASDLRNARITKESDGKECWQQIFDNQTGRMTRSQEPCDATAYDSHGDPIPLGTIHRLDAISKSFSGR